MFSKNFSKYNLLKPLIVGLIVSVVFSLIFMLVFALAATSLDVNENTILIFSIISMSLGGFTGGLASAKILKQKGFLVGAINGVVFFFLITFISFAVSQAPVSAVSLIKLITFVLSSVLGGIIGVNTTKKRKI